jgi:type IV secretory pathway VirB10-like protein
MAAIFGFLGAAQSAQSECLSPSSASGGTATTVYRCLDQQSTTRQDPITSPNKTTVVERGPATDPWFAPKPGDNPAETAEPAPQGQAAEPPPQAQTERAREIVENEPDKNSVVQKKSTRKKFVKLKPAKAKTTKALAAKTKPAKKAKETKAASEKPDENTVVWTRKDMPLGNRIVNWLGL